MTIIDQKGRLFGKVNLLDLVVVLAVVAVAGRFGYKAMTKEAAAPAGETKTVQVKFYLPNVTQPTVAFLRPGVEVYDSKSNAHMGKIVAAETKPTMIVGPEKEYESKTRVDLTITVEGTGRVTSNGSSLGGIELRGGRLFELKTPEWAFQPVLIDLPIAPKP
ncbi:MAG: hypothetical protein K0R39_1026 [Symbiobacteriaceae bacterium]|nr:hypothetical protein [Symbiobacteriaceae bacterium]